ncbi:DNA-directed RNA polymerase specialized sigma24 family protein [Streptacidiphilus sp. MAP12-20]|uniref:hypothetical protein n=1 Tax=Streptacidiphilus sp. MAP12-20 TaxID=3156299 RepID=UPI0035191C1E
MTQGDTATPASGDATTTDTAPGPQPALAAWTRARQEHHAALAAYARSLTGDALLAEDLTAEALFHLWRRSITGQPVDYASDRLAADVRRLVAERARGEDAPGRGQCIAQVEVLAEAVRQLPHRWVRALWLAEVEQRPLDDAGKELGTSREATAALLDRAEEGLRQAYLRAQPGTPADPACAPQWEQLRGVVLAAGNSRQDRLLRTHTEFCSDCHDRLALLREANRRVPALVGPALLSVFATGAVRFLVPLGASGRAGHPQGVLRHRRVRPRTLSGRSVPGGPGTLAAAGGLALAAAGAVAAMTLTGAHASPGTRATAAGLSSNRSVTTTGGAPSAGATAAATSASPTPTPNPTSTPSAAAPSGPATQVPMSGGTTTPPVTSAPRRAAGTAPAPAGSSAPAGTTAGGNGTAAEPPSSSDTAPAGTATPGTSPRSSATADPSTSPTRASTSPSAIPSLSPSGSASSSPSGSATSPSPTATTNTTPTPTANTATTTATPGSGTTPGR